ncbi:MAG TPA: hypothetical protein VJH33_00605 [Candidatus Paceibacterota bacterium]
MIVRNLALLGLLVAFGLAHAYPVQANVEFEQNLISDEKEFRYYGRLLVCKDKNDIPFLVQAPANDDFVRILTGFVDLRECMTEKNPLLGPRVFLGLFKTGFGIICHFQYETDSGSRFAYKHVKSENFSKRCDVKNR